MFWKPQDRDYRDIVKMTETELTELEGMVLRNKKK
jgi:hypothetical protein